MFGAIVRSLGLNWPKRVVKVRRNFVDTVEADYFEFYDSELNANALALAQRLLLKYGSVELGRNRLVFHSKFAVLKVPTCHDGICDNDWEGSICGGIARSREWENQEEANYPNTRWLELDGFICCMMEKVKPLEFKDYSEVPDWVGSIDCGQVGTSVISGRLVAFDYGYK